MSDYTGYTYVNPGYTNPVINYRLGYRAPRTILLPPYLAINPYYVEFMQAVDTVFNPMIDAKIDIIQNIRNMWLMNPDTEETSLEGEIIDFSTWTQPDRTILVQQVNMLGLKLQNAGVVSNNSYQTMARFVGQYWFQKGTQAFIEFINFCLGSNLVVYNLWTQDYVTFVVAGDPAIGTPVWEGGSWYPTTHVTISGTGGDLANVDLQTLTAFFYEIANYNLVLHNIDTLQDLQIVAALGDTNTTIVAMGALGNNSLVLSNTYSYGVTGPGSVNTGAVSTSILTVGAPNMSTGYILAAPNAWVQTASGKNLPVYSPALQIPSSNGTLSTVVQADSSAPYKILMGPVAWVDIPGSTSSSSKVPVFTTASLTTTDVSALTTQCVGNPSLGLLANPDGFEEIAPGQYTPYWN